MIFSGLRSRNYCCPWSILFCSRLVKPIMMHLQIVANLFSCSFLNFYGLTSKFLICIYSLQNAFELASVFWFWVLSFLPWLVWHFNWGAGDDFSTQNWSHQIVYCLGHLFLLSVSLSVDFHLTEISWGNDATLTNLFKLWKASSDYEFIDLKKYRRKKKTDITSFILPARMEDLCMSTKLYYCYNYSGSLGMILALLVIICSCT